MANWRPASRDLMAGEAGCRGIQNWKALEQGGSRNKVLE